MEYLVRAARVTDIDRLVALSDGGLSGASDTSPLAAADLLRQLVYLPQASIFVAEAQRVVVVGLRSSYPIAMHLRQSLSQGRPGVTLAPQPGQSLSEELIGLGKQDAAVVVAFRRRPDNIEGLLEILRNSGTPTILLADPTEIGRAHV